MAADMAADVAADMAAGSGPTALLEVDHLDTLRDTFSPGAGRTVRQGIELDALGRRLAYWLWPDHPGDPWTPRARESVRVPASVVAHCYRLERAGQLRGIPWLAPVALAAHDLSDWQDASLVRARVAALFAAFITDENPDDPVAGVTSPAATRSSRRWRSDDFIGCEVAGPCGAKSSCGQLQYNCPVICFQKGLVSLR